MPPHITVVGSLNMDLVARTPRVPRPGETVLGGEFTTIPGGKGANQAVAAAYLGAHVTMVGRVGDDDFAGRLLHNLDRCGVDRAFVKRDLKNATGVALITVDDSGQNSIVVAPGANSMLSPDDIRQAESVISGSDAVLLQLEVPLETVIETARLAKSHRVMVVLNPAPALDLPVELLKNIDVLIPNETEAALLTDYPVEEEAYLELTARALMNMGVNVVVITRGGRGALLATENRFTRCAPFPAHAVDATAAGDAFIAGFSVARSESRSLEEAVRWGNAAGALAVTKLGAQSSLPKRSEVEDLLKNSV